MCFLLPKTGNIRHLFAAAIILSAFNTCFADQTPSVIWHEDGRVVSGSGQAIQLNLHNLYDGLAFDNKLYVIGFFINSDGINILRIAEVSEELGTVDYWTFEHIISDIFAYHNSIHINDTDGQVFKLSGAAWQKSDLIFPANSQVVFSDNDDKLVVCHPSSLPMTGHHRGGCFSINPNWHFDFTWFVVTPKVCDGRLFIYENKMNGGVVRVLSLETGEVLHSKPLTIAPDDLCGVSGN